MRSGEYLVEAYHSGAMRVLPRVRVRRQNGDWGKWKDLSVRQKSPALSEEDQVLVLALTSAGLAFGGYYGAMADAWQVIEILLPRVCATGRLYATRDDREYGPPRWDDGPPWEFAVEVTADPDRPVYRLVGQVVRGEERLPLSGPLIIFSAGWIIWPDRIARLRRQGGFGWIEKLRGAGAIEVPTADGEKFAAALAQMPSLPRLALPEALQLSEAKIKPRPRLTVGAAAGAQARKERGRRHDFACGCPALRGLQLAARGGAFHAQTAHAGSHRLALSGTPIENHLGELWSLMEFLNPGFLGHLSRFDSKWARNPDPESRAVLARAVRPFILRRTKAPVAADLPERQEETLHCELPDRQRKLYDELREHYRAALLARVAKTGLNRARMHVLEALLRLRQAACHPALLDGAHARHPSDKFEALLPQIEEVIEEGHKALVFSQFTSLLALLRGELDGRKIAYEYLDGQTRDRQKRVDRFQNDAACPLFLVSLKAGGLGLNLTAAEYVFLLDPWWNPAVEAQAIDRAHRIGQTNNVFAYRLIAKDTVEEKVLELQGQKRELAAAIINDDNSVIRNLTRDDIEFLFG